MIIHPSAALESDSRLRTVCILQSCVYKRGFDTAMRRNTKQSVPILDIEELVETMKEKEVLLLVFAPLPSCMQCKGARTELTNCGMHAYVRSVHSF